jgi:hypothetical protein
MINGGRGEHPGHESSEGCTLSAMPVAIIYSVNGGNAPTATTELRSLHVARLLMYAHQGEPGVKR